MPQAYPRSLTGTRGEESGEKTMPDTELFNRYRCLRAISTRHHSGALGCLARPAILEQARHLGLAYGLRWSRPAGQSGGLGKLGAGCHQAANFSIPDAQYMSSGVPPANIECGRREL